MKSRPSKKNSRSAGREPSNHSFLIQFIPSLCHCLFIYHLLIIIIHCRDHEKKAAQLARLEDQLKKLEMNKTDKEEGKEIALGTSKLNYLDPRISVAW
jgi:hypothetical protein